MSTPNTPYQVMPPLTHEEFEALKADIGSRGLLVPIEKDEQGNILDGHHRARACEELGITGCPVIIRSGLTEGQKIEHALTLNLCRRHLSKEQRLTMVQGLSAQGWSLRRIAQVTGFSKSQIGRDLQPVPNGTLSPSEQARLAECESVIERGMDDLVALSEQEFDEVERIEIERGMPPSLASVIRRVRMVTMGGTS